MVKWKQFYLSLLGIFFVFTSLLIFSDKVEAAGETTPYELPSGFSKKWNANNGSKDLKMESGKQIIYDVYDKKYLNDGFEIKTKKFGNKKSQPYLHFYGWAINFGYMTHTKTNHSIYVVAYNKEENKYKYYSTILNNVDVSQEVSYNIHNKKPGEIVYNQCPDSAKNKSNLECNMLYENVGFQAYIPLDELFPDPYKKGKWKLYIVTRVNQHYVYDRLVVPFEFSKKPYANGQINLTSGVNANTLKMNSYPVMKQKQIGVSNPGQYFTKGKSYKMTKANETTATSIWFQVKDGVSKRWSTSVYWTFQGDQAVIDYNVEVKPSVKLNVYASGCYYKKPAKTPTISSTITVKDGKNKTYTKNEAKVPLKFSSSNTSVVKVVDGKLVALKNGSTTITISYKDPYTKKVYTDKQKVTITKCLDPIDPNKACLIEFEQPKIKNKMAQTHLPAADGKIKAEGVYDVEQGIPTSEYLKTETNADRYLFEQLWQNKAGNVILKVPVYRDYIYTWKDKKETKTKTLRSKQDVEIKRPYSYWDIGRLHMSGFDSTTLYNYAFNSGSDLLENEEDLNIGANHDEDVKEHVVPPECKTFIAPPKNVKGKPPAKAPKEDLKSLVEAEVDENTVSNDSVMLDDQIIMDDTETTATAPKPINLPQPTKVKLENRNILIENTKVNYFKAVSEGESLYTNYIYEESADDGSKPKIDYFTDEDGEAVPEEDVDYSYIVPLSVNPVTIHTPIIINGQTSDETAYDQRINQVPHQSKRVLILDRPFDVSFGTSGMHRDIPGYRSQDYMRYVAQKQVKFPFDVYEAATNQFYPANTWITYSGVTTSMSYKMPIWVPEGQYTIEYRAYAINNPTGTNSIEGSKNTTIPNSSFELPDALDQSAAHIVTNTQTVDVVGRVYDFKVTDVSDFNWEKVFRTGAANEHTGNLFWVGMKDRNGNTRGNARPNVVLPIMPGKNTTGLKNTAVKTGYNFRFDLKTIGNMYGAKDAIRIKPKFYYVNVNGGTPQEVDLYYHNNEDYFTKIGSTADKVYRDVVLNHPLRNVEQNDLIRTAEYTYRHYEDYGLSKPEGFQITYLKNFVSNESKKPIQTGPYGWQILNNQLRTLIGPLKESVPAYSMVPAADVVRSEQNWYGDYSLPAKTYAVTKGTNVAAAGSSSTKINENHPMFLKNGYIIVNFDIETIRDGEVNNPYLSYYKSVNNQWKREGFTNTQKDALGNIFNLNDGDTVFYHADKSSLEDFSSSVTH